MEIPSSNPGSLLLTKVEQVLPVADSMPQEVVKPQAAPSPQADEVTSPERFSSWGRVLRRPVS